MSRTKNAFSLYLFAFLLTGVLIGSLFIGRFDIAFDDVIRVFTGLASGEAPLVSDRAYSVLVNVRLPRILLVALVGMALSISGAVFQAIFRNPLVSPDILGVSTGAGFGAVLGLLIRNGSMLNVQLLAFFFGLLAVMAAYLISRAGRFNRVLMLILAGIIVSAFFNSLISIAKYIADPYHELPAMVFWSMGGFYRISWVEVRSVSPVMIVGIASLFMLRWKLNIISLGDDEATVLGLNVAGLRKLFIFLATLIVASGIAVCGTIGWVGLVIPHFARMIVGPNHGRMLVIAGLAGGFFLLLMDNIARTLTAAEIPIGILTSLIGAPFFCFVLLTRRKSGWA